MRLECGQQEGRVGRVRVREATRDWIAWGLEARETNPHLFYGMYVTLADQ